MPSFILIRPTVWPQCSNVADRTGQDTQLTDSIGRTVLQTVAQKTVEQALRSAWFEDLTEVGAVYEITNQKPRVTIHRPFQVGIAVYQLAKLRILEFYHDFLDHFIDRQDFELIRMDTDSLYFALSANKIDDVVKPELTAEFDNCNELSSS